MTRVDITHNAPESIWDVNTMGQVLRAYTRWILLGITLLSLVPLWVARYPPMADLPQHAAQVALLRDLHDPRFPYASMFHLNWFTPYLVGYLLIYILTPLFGIVGACKVAISLFVIGLPLSTAILVRSVDLDPFWAILCVPCVYGFAYQWGLLNFLIAAPLGMLYLTFVIRNRYTSGPRTVTLFGCYAVVLFFCHALICAFFVGCAGLYLLASSKSLKQALLRIAPLTAVLPVALLWLKRTSANPAAKRPLSGDWNWIVTNEAYYGSLSDELHMRLPLWGRVTGLPSNLVGVLPSWPHALLAVSLILLPFCAGLRFRRQFTTRLPLFVCIAVLLWCPMTIFGTDFVYQRFAMFLIPLLLLSLEERFHPARTLAVKVAAISVVIAFISGASLRAAAFNQETRGFERAVALMVPGQRALSLEFDHEDRLSIAPTFLHFPSWYAAEKQGVVDPSVAMMHPELVVYRSHAEPKAVLWDFEWDPEQFDWNDYSATQYRYFVVRSPADLTTSLFSAATCAVYLRFHEAEWWLYERATPCGTPAIAPGATR